MDEQTRKTVVEVAFMGFWLLLFFIGWGVCARTARDHPRAYRAFIPVFALTVLLCLVGSIELGDHYYPHAQIPASAVNP